MMNIAQHLPVEIIRQILWHVEPVYIYNAASICWEWLEAGKDILAKKRDEYGPSFDSSHPRGRYCYQCMNFEKSFCQNNGNHVRLAKWRKAASQKLSWYEAGHFTVQLSFMDDQPEQTSKNGSRIFTSANGRLLLRNEVSTDQVRNSLFSTEDVRSFIQIGENWRHVICNRAADITYRGFDIIAEDLQPSFLTALPTTAPLVDVSFYQHREPSLTLTSYRNSIPESNKDYGRPVHLRLPNQQFAWEHCVDIALLSEEREVHLLTATLKYITPKKAPFQKMRATTLGWCITGQGSVSNVCQGRGPLNAVLLDVKFEAVVIGCHDGVEIICLHPREASPGDKLRGSTRKWINMCMSGRPCNSGLRVLTSIVGQGPGPVLTITESRNEIFLFTKANTATGQVSERIAGLAFSYNPLWDQKSLAWSHPVVNSTANGVPRELESITPVIYSDSEYVLWNPIRKCIEVIYVSTSHAHLRPYVIVRLEAPMWSGELRPPSYLAAVYHHQEDIIVSSYLAENNIPVYDEHLKNTLESTVATNSIKEDIYLSQYDAASQSGNFDFYCEYFGKSAQTKRKSIPQHYIGSVISPQGIKCIKIDIRHSGGFTTDVMHSHEDFYKRTCDDQSDHLVVIVFVLKGGSGVVVWYLAKAIKADLLGGRREKWRWKEQKTSSSKDTSKWGKRGCGIFQPLRKVLKQDEHSWTPEIDQSIAGWALEKDSAPTNSP